MDSVLLSLFIRMIGNFNSSHGPLHVAPAQNPMITVQLKQREREREEGERERESECVNESVKILNN